MKFFVYRTANTDGTNVNGEPPCAGAQLALKYEPYEDCDSDDICYFWHIELNTAEDFVDFSHQNGKFIVHPKHWGGHWLYEDDPRLVGVPAIEIYDGYRE